MNSVAVALSREGLDLVNLREHELYEVLALVPWARGGLSEYVQRFRPDLAPELGACLEELELVEQQ